jgi:mannose-6-phosphate isomerase-like protein (cupin superfamily)
VNGSPPSLTSRNSRRKPTNDEAIRVVNLNKKFGLINERWKPKIVAQLNDSYVKAVKVKGEFVWHHHDHEDELFLVVKGRLTIKLKKKDLHLKEGELVVIPKGIEHKPAAKGDVELLLFEPKDTLNTGNVRNKRTAEVEWI